MLTIIVLVAVSLLGLFGYVERATLAKQLKSGISAAVADIEAELSKGESLSKEAISKTVAFLKSHI